MAAFPSIVGTGARSREAVVLSVSLHICGVMPWDRDEIRIMSFFSMNLRSAGFYALETDRTASLSAKARTYIHEES